MRGSSVVEQSAVNRKVEGSNPSPAANLGTCDYGDGPHAQVKTCKNWRPLVEPMSRGEWARVFAAFFVFAVVAYLVLVFLYVLATGGNQ